MKKKELKKKNKWKVCSTTENRRENQNRKRKLIHKFKHITKETAERMHTKGKKRNRLEKHHSLRLYY